MNVIKVVIENSLEKVLKYLNICRANEFVNVGLFEPEEFIYFSLIRFRSKWSYTSNILIYCISKYEENSKRS